MILFEKENDTYIIRPTWLYFLFLCWKVGVVVPEFVMDDGMESWH